MSEFVKMSNAEYEVMEVLWDAREPMDTLEIHKVLSMKKKWAYNTVGTFMTRLADKGFITCKKLGRNNFYQAAVGKDQYREMETRHFLNNVHQGSAKSLIAALYKDKLTEQDIDEMLAWIERKK